MLASWTLLSGMSCFELTIDVPCSWNFLGTWMIIIIIITEWIHWSLTVTRKWVCYHLALKNNLYWMWLEIYEHVLCLIWFTWHYNHSRVSMVVADGLEPEGHQHICNHQGDFFQSLGIRGVPTSTWVVSGVYSSTRAILYVNLYFDFNFTEICSQWSN